MKKKVWITWQSHRRTDEIVSELNCELIVIKTAAPKLLRHITLAVKTVPQLYKHRKSIIFAQNPSRILAAIAALLKPIFGYKLIVDRHTNFRIGKPFSYDPRIWLLIYFSDISIRLADLTIVTNDFLKKHVEEKGGRGFVLPDRLPRFSSEGIQPKQPPYIVFICTYADDEPYLNVIEASKLLNGVKIYITGNYKKSGIAIKKHESSTLSFTGYLSEHDYLSLLTESTAIIDFTTMEWCLVCGGYECMALERPLITSDTKALKELYGVNALYSSHEPKDIADKINQAISEYNALSEQMRKYKHIYNRNWRTVFSHLSDYLEQS